MPKLIHCPYYLYEKGTEIHCEGKAVRQFPNLVSKTLFVSENCGNITGWVECAKAKEITKKYEENVNV